MRLYLIDKNKNKQFIREFFDLNELEEYILDFIKQNHVDFFNRLVEVKDNLVRITYDINDNGLPDIEFELQCENIYLEEFRNGCF